MALGSRSGRPDGRTEARIGETIGTNWYKKQTGD